jgi:hypothetical protein
MASSQPQNRAAASAAKLLVKLTIAVILCAGSVMAAQVNYAHPSKPKEPSTATTQTSIANTDPSRTIESHATSGDRSVDEERVEVLGPNGGYLPDHETETETIHINATTTRTVERTYRWDANGQRNLVQVTEEEARNSASGEAHVVRTVSSSDLNGNVQVTQREVADTRKTSPNEQETKTTFYILDGNGGLSPSLQTQEIRKRSADNTVAVKTSKLWQDSSGHWQVGEVKESTAKEVGKIRTTEERVSHADSEGKLSEVSRTVGTETENAAGEKSNTVETYSTYVPGLAPDGSLHLNRRVMTVQNFDSSGKATEQQVELPKPGDPIGGLQVAAKTKYIVQYGGSVAQQARATQVRDVNGNFNTIEVETQKSDRIPATQAQTAPSDKAK